MHSYSIAIHGGAGTILRSAMTAEKEAAYRNSLLRAIESGTEVLAREGSALDAVEACVRMLEDDPHFNAGKGAVFTSDGRNELDASIMDGRTQRAGAVACVSNVKNPVSLARLVMEKTEHVLLTGEGAMQLAREMQVEMAPDEYFYEQFRYEQLQLARRANASILDHADDKEKKFGTVGAVALDLQGNLAAATSTGGMTNKKYGRIGDSPLIGAGTYANNFTCAVSCTGHGEFFIRSVVAYDVSCLMEYKGMSLKEACDFVVQDKLVKIGGVGGLIAVDHLGGIEMPFNSEGMYRASARSGQRPRVSIYKDE